MSGEWPSASAMTDPIVRKSSSSIPRMVAAGVPMRTPLATGNSTAAAADTVKRAGATSVRLIAIIAAPEGIERIHRDHPDVQIVVAAIDRGLNERGFIVPGLGDAGDRLYGTK